MSPSSYPQSGEMVILAHFWKTINVVHYAGGLRILADGNRMPVKEERALADGILTPFHVFLFGGGRELQVHSANFLSTYSQPFCKVTTYYPSHITEEKSSRK